MSHCPSSPNGMHCYHGYSGAWWGINPPPMHCCWCGQTPAAEHGPHCPGLTFTGTGTVFDPMRGPTHPIPPTAAGKSWEALIPINVTTVVPPGMVILNNVREW